MARLIQPAMFDRVNVRSRTGDEVHLSFICLSLTTRQIVRSMNNRDYKWIGEKIEAAVHMAREAGCQVVGFGGFTSILTRNCRRVKTNGVSLTTGNSLTVGMGIRALREAAREMGIDLANARLAVVGATGNIAGTYAVIMAPLVTEVVLVVRDLASPKLAPVLDAIHQAAPLTPLRVVDNMEALSKCSLIVAASNTPEPLIYAHHLGHGAGVICDISLPSDVADEVGLKRPDVLVIRGGVVRLPYNDEFSIGGIPLTKGHVFACMAETLLMGLEGAATNGSYGPVTVAGVENALAMAHKHGFSLGDIHANAPRPGAMSFGYSRTRSRTSGTQCHV
jgi:predicted amino acid dehydrogenase